MDFLDILLIIISSAGLLHGLSFAVYLSFFKKKKTTANILLGLLLVFMAFRIGKSVLLHFGDDLEPIFIFIGLAFLLLIGPLLRWYVIAMTRPNFLLPKTYLLELIPFVLVFVSSFMVTNSWFDENNRTAVIVFGSVLISIYLHFAFYIIASAILIRQMKKKHQHTLLTKFQKSILQWLSLLIVGFVIIWISYVLNIIENTVPYIVGPIMYSLVIYFLSYKAFQLKTTDVDGNVFKENKDIQLFDQLSQFVVKEKRYLEPDFSLSILSKLIGKSTQKTSEIINQYGNQNFNDFINYYRVQDAKSLLKQDSSQLLKIASIAFDVGFSSLSSFNAAFKKFEGVTPSAYRKENI
ncbi:AraC family transcriptional regulator [Aquimarina spongiae]|uniref:Transcriptional regulator, AraC family n=1 Tax=Aquimarina spongiae TaxID=570521 RepID=A0A1M6B057_9FLAO|nr:helix-turn-helix domain-containing protein [Aquimarina spongiae]SHI41853.1 transcriptional regulator, AraC family [Aquimarina spongiae]